MALRQPWLEAPRVQRTQSAGGNAGRNGPSTNQPQQVPNCCRPAEKEWTSMQLREVSVAGDARDLARDIDAQNLYARAQEAATRAHAPYSRFRTGAALQTCDGTIVTGCNVENCSFGLTICAERAAVSRAVSEGHQAFAAIAVATEADQVHTVASCGACLQVLAEFDHDDALLVIFPEGGTLRVSRLSGLLPVRFRLQND